MRFCLETILSVTTGRLLTKSTGRGNGIGDMYKLLGHMSGDSPFTHQLGRFAKECKPVLLAKFPELANADLAILDALLDLYPPEQACKLFVDECKTTMWADYEIEANSAVVVFKDPIDEAIEMKRATT